MPRVALPLVALLAIAIFAAHARDREYDRRVGRQRGDGVVQLQTEIFQRELEWAAFAIRGLAEDIALVQHLSGKDRREDLEREFARFCSVSRIFDQVRLIDENQRECIRVNFDGAVARAVPEDELQSKEGRYYVDRAWNLSNGGVYTSPFDLNVEHGQVEEPWKPVIRIASPCFDSNGVKRAILVLNYLGSDLLSRLSRAASSVTGWSTLVNEEGYFLEAPDPALSWGFLFDAPPSFVAEHPRIWETIASSTHGTILGDRGLFTYKQIATQHANFDSDRQDDLGLWAVLFVPKDELFASSHAKLRRMLWVGSLFALVILAASWRLAYVGAMRERHESRLAASEQRLRRLSSRLLDVLEDERRRLSRDMHDDLGQLATVLTIDLGRAASVGDLSRKDALIRHAREGAVQLLETVRRISASLRDNALDDLGLEGSLRALVADLEQRTGLQVEADFELDGEEVPRTVAVHIYRIVQEALSNVLRHSGTENASVRVERDDEHLLLVVADDGKGFDSEAPAEGMGLLGMRERVELLGGELRLLSAPGCGTRIEISVSLRPAGDQRNVGVA